MNRPLYYILVNGKVRAAGYADWAEGFSTSDRRIDWTDIDEVQISTVFLGLDHATSGPPLIFETLVMGGAHDQEMARYSTLGQAKAGHWAMVDKVKASLSRGKE